MKSLYAAWEILGMGFLLLGSGVLMGAIFLAGSGHSDRVQILSTLAAVFLPAGGTALVYGLQEKRQQELLRVLVSNELDQTAEVLKRKPSKDFQIQFVAETWTFSLAPVYDLYVRRGAELQGLTPRNRQNFLLLSAKMQSYHERFSRFLNSIADLHGGIPDGQNSALLHENLKSEAANLVSMAQEIAGLCDGLSAEVKALK